MKGDPGKTLYRMRGANGPAFRSALWRCSAPPHCQKRSNQPNEMTPVYDIENINPVRTACTEALPLRRIYRLEPVAALALIVLFLVALPSASLSPFYRVALPSFVTAGV